MDFAFVIPIRKLDGTQGGLPVERAQVVGRFNVVALAGLSEFVGILRIDVQFTTRNKLAKLRLNIDVCKQALFL